MKTNEAAYVPKEGDIVVIENDLLEIPIRPYLIDDELLEEAKEKPNIKLKLVGLSLARIEADRNERDEKLIEKLVKDYKGTAYRFLAPAMSKEEIENVIEEMQKYYQEVFASVDSECQANVKKCLDSEEKKEVVPSNDGIQRDK